MFVLIIILGIMKLTLRCALPPDRRRRGLVQPKALQIARPHGIHRVRLCSLAGLYTAHLHSISSHLTSYLVPCQCRPGCWPPIPGLRATASIERRPNRRAQRTHSNTRKCRCGQIRLNMVARNIIALSPPISLSASPLFPSLLHLYVQDNLPTLRAQAWLYIHFAYT